MKSLDLDLELIAKGIVEDALANIGMDQILNYLDDIGVDYRYARDADELDDLYDAVRALADDTEQRVHDLDR